MSREGHWKGNLSGRCRVTKDLTARDRHWAIQWTVFSRSTPPYQSARFIELKSGEVPNKVGYYIGYLINYGPYTSVDRVTTPAGVLVFELGRLTLAERRTLEAIAWNVGVVEPNGDFNCQNWLAALLSVAVARGLFAEDRVRVVIESALREDKPDTGAATHPSIGIFF